MAKVIILKDNCKRNCVTILFTHGKRSNNSKFDFNSIRYQTRNFEVWNVKYPLTRKLGQNIYSHLFNRP